MTIEDAKEFLLPGTEVQVVLVHNPITHVWGRVVRVSDDEIKVALYDPQLSEYDQGRDAWFTTDEVNLMDDD